MRFGRRAQGLAVLFVAASSAMPRAAFASDKPFLSIEAGYSAPIRWSGGVAGNLSLGGEPLERPWLLRAQGFAGQAGGKLAFGVTRCCVAPVFAPAGYGGPVGTLTLRGAVVRTWRSPSGVAAGRSLIGGEIEYTVVYVLTLSAGAFVPTGGDSRRWVYTWGVGVGLPLLF